MPYGYIMGSIFEHSINNLGIPEYLKTAVKTIRKICMEAATASSNNKTGIIVSTINGNKITVYPNGTAYINGNETDKATATKALVNAVKMANINKAKAKMPALDENGTLPAGDQFIYIKGEKLFTSIPSDKQRWNNVKSASDAYMAEMDKIIQPAKYALTYIGASNAIPATVAQTTENNKTGIIVSTINGNKITVYPNGTAYINGNETDKATATKALVNAVKMANINKAKAKMPALDENGTLPAGDQFIYIKGEKLFTSIPSDKQRWNNVKSASDAYMAEMDKIIQPAKYALTYIGASNAIPATVAQTTENNKVANQTSDVAKPASGNPTDVTQPKKERREDKYSPLQVKMVQMLLNNDKYHNFLDTDGIIGENTSGAVEFAKNLDADGKFGPKTDAAFKELLKEATDLVKNKQSDLNKNNKAGIKEDGLLGQDTINALKKAGINDPQTIFGINPDATEKDETKEEDKSVNVGNPSAKDWRHSEEAKAHKVETDFLNSVPNTISAMSADNSVKEDLKKKYSAALITLRNNISATVKEESTPEIAAGQILYYLNSGVKGGLSYEQMYDQLKEDHILGKYVSSGTKDLKKSLLQLTDICEKINPKNEPVEDSRNRAAESVNGQHANSAEPTKASGEKAKNLANRSWGDFFEHPEKYPKDYAGKIKTATEMFAKDADSNTNGTDYTKSALEYATNNMSFRRPDGTISYMGISNDEQTARSQFIDDMNAIVKSSANGVK